MTRNHVGSARAASSVASIPKAESAMAQKEVLLLCGDYMEDSEAMVPFQALQAYGLAVHAVCPGKNSGDLCRTSVHQRSTHQTYSKTRGHNFKVNFTFDEVDVKNYDGLVIPGKLISKNEEGNRLVREFWRSDKPVAAVCHVALILAAAGVLNGRKCTAFPTLGPVLVAAGAHWVEPQTSNNCC
ncbi:hypothetical protein RJT34_11451 [Clitoria ternatea]|uniref:DJ-1/PfpI domain-containing protein n=1 Tax=Clitoria ternatea TaxID=43366 RepID=A0AAN9PJN8_CLITE